MLGRLGGWNQLEAKLFGAFGQGFYDPLTVALFVVGLTLIDVLLALRHQRVDQSRQLMGDGGDGPGAILGGSLNPVTRLDKGGHRHWAGVRGRLCPLRSYKPLVTRWIKTYVTYDTVDKKIIRATLAVEGGKLE